MDHGYDRRHERSLKIAGFNKMCRFYSYPVYKYLWEYDYAMRLDDDSFIEEEIKYDIFQDMHENGYDYGYIRRKKISTDPP